MVLLLASWLAAPAPESCDTCEPKKICKEHKDADSAALKEWQPQLRSKEEAERLAALQALAQQSLSHRNAPSEPIAKALAVGLRDESVTVQSESARLLLDGQHPEIAVRSLIEEVEDVRAEFAKIGRQRGSSREDGGNSQFEELEAYSELLVTGLGTLPDDRSVKTLVQLFTQLGGRGRGGGMTLRVARSLAQLEAREGVKALATGLSQVKAADSRGRGRRGGGGGGGSPGGNDEGGRAEQVHEILAALARANDLDDIPSWGEDAADDWKEWFGRNQKHFPAKLGRISIEKVADP
jgi:hypothetical protein